MILINCIEESRSGKKGERGDRDAAEVSPWKNRREDGNEIIITEMRQLSIDRKNQTGL